MQTLQSLELSFRILQCAVIQFLYVLVLNPSVTHEQPQWLLYHNVLSFQDQSLS